MLKLYISNNLRTTLTLLIVFFAFIINSKAQAPVANFGVDKRFCEVYEGVVFSDSSTNSPIQWEWEIYDSFTNRYNQFDPISDINSGYVVFSSGFTSQSKNPEVYFYRAGVYTVRMRCRNSSGWSAKKTITKYIKVGEPTTYYLGYGTYGTNNDNIVDSDYGTIMDDGGPGQSYSNNQGQSTRSQLLIKPCKAKSITLTMSQLKFKDAGDALYVFDDDHENYSHQIAKWTLGSTTNRTVTATSGSMYLIYKSNGTGTDSGYIGTYTSVLDTVPPTYTLDFHTDSLFNSVPFYFKNLSTGFPGTPRTTWLINGAFQEYSKNGLNTTIYTDGIYSICMNYNGCNIDTTVCKTITVYTPNSPSTINFSKTTISSGLNQYAFKPTTTKSNHFEWSISPSSYILLNPPTKPSSYKPGTIIYNACPGDTLPSPHIWFQDTTCYTITLKAWYGYDSANTDASYTKSNYVCAVDFRKTFGIFGKVFLDQNNDCSLSGTEPILASVPVKLYDSTNQLIGLTYATSNGLYLFEKSVGKYRVEVDLKKVPLKITCPIGIDTMITLVKGVLSNGYNFPAVCGSADVAAQNIRPLGAVFPGRKHRLTIKAGFLSKGILENCQNSGDSATIKVKVNGKVSYQGMLNSSPSPNSVAGITYTWRIKDLMKFNNELDMSFKVDTNAQSTDSIVVDVEIRPLGKDKDTSNNKLKFVYKVSNSYDPNIKETYPEKVLPKYNDWFYYTIHFQNTGNAPAYNIRFEDSIDAQLDYETMEVLDYSHPNRIAFNKNILKFYFDDIMLPDSFTDSKGSIGYVQYRIKPKANLPLGTKIYNTAYIYFDYNSPVVTNTTVNEYAEPKGNSVKAIANDAFVIYPNPSHGIYKLQLKNNSSTKLTILNSMGQVIKMADINGQTLIDLSAYANGIYFVRIVQGDQIYYSKLLKE